MLRLDGTPHHISGHYLMRAAQMVTPPAARAMVTSPRHTGRDQPSAML